MNKSLRLFLPMAVMLCFCLLIGGAWAQGNPAGDLDQGKNETPAARVDPVQWVNGNLNENQAHYLEGMSVPYRLVLTNLSLGSHTVNIEWDTRDQSKAAIDYITHFQRLEPHSQFLPGHSAENVNPLLGLSGTFNAPTTFPIPVPSSMGSPMPGQPTSSFEALPPGERVMTIYNGSITSMGYASEDLLRGASAKTRLTITLNATASTVVLAWGGHIASNEDWLGGAHPGGSPYHTRFIDLDGKGGNQDRSLKSEAVFTCEVSGVSPVCAGTTNTYTVTTNVGNPSFSWSFTSNTSGASFVGSTTGSSVQVNSGTGGSFTLQVKITSNIGGVQCDLAVTVNPGPACSITGPDPVCPGLTNSYTGPPGMAEYAWSISGSGAISGATNQQTVSVRANSACNGSYTLTLKITAPNGCTNTCTKTVSVIDNTAPVISSLPAPSMIQCPATPQFTTPTATDACDPAPKLTFADVTTPGSCPQKHSVTRTWTATDACGNSSTASQTITVEDNTAPVISSLPAPSTIQCPATPQFTTPTATDACDPAPKLTFADVTTPGSCPQKHSVTRTWTATDACGNSSTASQTITVEDNTAPVISSLPAPSTIQCPATPQFTTPTATDACDPAPKLTFADVTTPGSCPQEHSVTRTWTATDACGNSSTASQTITVEDNTAPVISSLPAPSTIQCPATPQFTTPTATDACDPAPKLTFADVTTPGSCPQKHSVTRTWTATDACGNSSTASQTITVEDNTAPVISSLPAPSTIQCPATPQFTTPTATDACDPAPKLTFADVTTPGSCPQEHSVTRTWTATDACGNSSTASQTITVEDNTAPVISSLPAPSTIQCPATPQFTTPTTTDACDPAPKLTFNDVTTPGTCAQEYSVTRIWTAMDACGNSSQASQTITVEDNTAPVLSGCPANANFQCISQVPAPATVTATDNCDGPITVIFIATQSNQGSSCNNTITRTWTARDACGNTASCTQIITVNDNEKPTITCPGPVTVQCFADVPAPDLNAVTASDNCGTPTVTFVGDVASGSCPKIITRTYKATDACGNFATCTQTITVEDKTAPVLSGCPANATFQCLSQVPAPATVTAIDNCDGTVQVTFIATQSNQGSSCNNKITRTWTATDACGNTASCTQTITVDDKIAPVLSGCPADANFQCISQVPAPATVTATDNCDGPITVIFIATQSNQGSSCNNTITRTWTARDACGNTASCTQIITVNDNEKPAITCPGPITVQCFADVPAPNLNAVTASDNCGTPTVTFVGDVVSGTCPKIITRTYKATDACGNFATCTQTITVDDKIAPVLSGCPADANFQCISEVPPPATVTATDNCDGPITVIFIATQSNQGSSCNNRITRTWTARDACGNTASCTQIITVNDNTAPVLSNCPSNAVGNCDDNPHFTFTPPTATDNCDQSPTVTCTRSDGKALEDPYPVGFTTITCVADDDCGNKSAECSFTVEIEACSEAHCTFTQGAYGNAGGKFNGETTLQILQRLIIPGSPLVVGKPMPGTSSITVPDGAEQCIINRLPAGGTSAQLSGSHSIMTLANSCASGQPVGNNGRWKNVLLGQTVTLSLNVRFDTDLGKFKLSSQFVTQRALPGPNGKLGDADDVPDPSDPGQIFNIPLRVLQALKTLEGLDETVTGLLELANRGLAGQSTGVATLSDINQAVDAINRGFDGCRFLVCRGSDCPDYLRKEAQLTESDGAELPAQYTLEAFPNPFNPSTQVQFDLPEQTFVTLKIYNVLGQEVMTLVDHVEHEPGSYAVRFDASRLISGVYFVRLQAAHHTMTRKILFAR